MASVNLFGIASQALSNVQIAINTVSQNVANTQNTNYNERQAVFQSANNVTNTITVQRVTDFSLQAQVLDANAAVGASDESQRLYQQLASIAGIDNNQTGTLQSDIEAFAAAWSAFQASPQDPSVEQTVIQTGNQFASDIRSQYQQLQDAQVQEQGQVQTDVTALNAALTQLGTINATARQENSTSDGVSAGTADQQDAAIATISQYVGVNVFRRPDGSVAVYTKNGVPLVDKIVNQFSYDAAQNNIYLSGTATPTSFNGTGSFNAGFQTGKIGAEIQALDPTVPATAGTPPGTAIFEKYREQLSAIVNLFATQNNQGFLDTAQTATITSGSNSVTVSSAAGWTVGDKISAPGIPSNTIITAINGNTVTLSNAATATSAGTPIGVANGYMDATQTATMTGGSTTITLPANANTLGWQPGMTISDTGGLIPAGTKIVSISANGTSVTLSNATGAGSAQVFASSENSPFNIAFDAAPSDRATDITTGSAAADPLPQGQGFFVTSHSPGQLDQASFSVNGSLLDGTATVNRQAAAPIVNFLTSATQSLGVPTAVGGYSVSNATPESIISGVTGNLAANQSTVETQDTNNTSTQQSLQNSYSARVGVDSDTELANLQILQNQYSATARLLNTADTLFQSLLNIQ